MFDFPIYSDIGGRTDAGIFQDVYSKWALYHRYYTGDVFKDKVASEVDSSEDRPEVFPVGMNIVKFLCQAQADAAFGYWTESVVSFEPRYDTTPDKSDIAAAELTAQILTNSNANSMLLEIELERNTYGGGVFKVLPDLKKPGHITWRRMPLGTCYPVNDPEDPDNILEIYIISMMSKEQCKLKYGIDAKSDPVYRVEHWTESEYETTVDGQKIANYSGMNPWRVVPFVYVPRMRTSDWFGDALTEDIIKPQDELNIVLADLSEAVNFNTHPIFYGYNLPKKFNSKNYPIGPGYFWDFGRVIGSMPAPFVGLLETKNPIPAGTFEYIKFLYEWTQTSTMTPPVAIGLDSNGSQRSGVTVELRMGSLIRSVLRSRAYLSAALQRGLYISGLILLQKDFSDISSHAVKRMMENRLTPIYAPIVPRDQQAVVDEVQKGMSTPVPTISLETATKKLGYGISEVGKIAAMISDERFKKIFERPEPVAPKGPNGAAGSNPTSEKKSAESSAEAE